MNYTWHYFGSIEKCKMFLLRKDNAIKGLMSELQTAKMELNDNEKFKEYCKIIGIDNDELDL